jgi:phosphatidylglycerol lysyltransferase
VQAAQPHPELADERQRALAILRGHAWTTVSFQLLEPDFHYWFDGDDAFVAYVDTGAAWVVGGAPVTSAARLVEVAHRFVAAGRAAGRRVSFFGCEARFVDASAMPALCIGEQPVWTPSAWERALASTSSLRAQVRRAANKGVTVRVVAPHEVIDEAAPLHRAIAALATTWLAARRMAPMGFLVQLEPLAFAAERVLIVAERGGELVGFLSAVPVYARGRLFIEDIVRAAAAPNGTTELLIDAAMRAAAVRGETSVTLGLAPLAGAIAPPLRLARRMSAPLYDFRGLHAFKAKLRPEAWEPVYLAAPAWPWIALHDGLTAFARGSLLRFGWQTLIHRPWLGALAATMLAAAVLVTIALVI